MISEIFVREDLVSQYRTRKSPLEFATFPHDQVHSMLTEGWEVYRTNKTTTRMKRSKPHGSYLEDREWTLFYRMGFTHLSGLGGANLISHSTGNNKAVSNQIDVVAVDDESAIAVECKSLETPGRRPSFQEDLGKFKLLQERFSQQIRQLNPTHPRSWLLW
jgi:DNA sulfur modification protein DndB